VGPPASHGHSSNAHHKLNKVISPLKLKNAGLHSLAKRKWKNRAKMVFVSNKGLLSFV
jgi:hypothetical protein